MEETPATPAHNIEILRSAKEKDMEESPAHNIEILRSAKGKDMLLIDGFIYHYDDRTKKAFRWVCSRYKDDTPCRVRVYTNLIDEWDLTRHRLESLVGDHPHGPAEAKKIARAREKKKQADAAGLPCTLSNNYMSRKHSNYKKIGKIPKATNCDTSNDECIFQDEGLNGDKPVLMLKTAKGFHMIAVEGCVYRLNSKSMLSCTYRWQCFRSKDLKCTARIYTECLSSGLHRYKVFRTEENKHNHQPYTVAKIEALIKINNIKILHGSIEQADKKPTKIMKLSTKDRGGNLVSTTRSELAAKPGSRKERSLAIAALYRYVDDAMDVLNDPKDGEITKFSFLPSLKGDRVLVINNMVFHYDCRGSINDRAYWSCSYRREKVWKCNCRLITEFTGRDTKIVKVSGDHSHLMDHIDYIEELLKNQLSMEHDAVYQSEDDDKDDYKHESDDASFGDREMKQEGTGNDDISEFLTLKRAKKENPDIKKESPETSIDENEESSYIEYDHESDPFQGTIEYVEMERVDIAQFQNSDSESNQYQKTSTTSTKRKFRKSYEYSKEDDDEDYSPPSKKHVKTKDRLNKIPSATKQVTNPDNMDITKISKLRSAKGGEFLCVDGYIYMKNTSSMTRSYWGCIKTKDSFLKCPARVVTTIDEGDNTLKVIKISNSHTHDIKDRLFNKGSKTLASPVTVECGENECDVNGGNKIDRFNGLSSKSHGQQTNKMDTFLKHDRARNNDKSTSEVEDTSPSETSKMRKSERYHVSWEENSLLKPWLEKGKNGIAFCKICQCDLKTKGGITDLKAHARTTKHIRKAEAIQLHSGSDESI